MDFFENYYYSINRFFLALVGLWPRQKSIEMRFRNIITGFGLICGLLPQGGIFLAPDLSFDLIVTMLQTFIPCIIFSSIYFNTVCNMGLMSRLFENMQRDWRDMNKAKELAIMQKYAAETKTYSKIIVCLFYMCTIFLLLRPIIPCFLHLATSKNSTNALKLPVHGKFLLDEEKYFYVYLLNTFITMPITITTGIAIYSTFVLSVQHVCGTLHVVRHNLQEAFNQSSFQTHSGTQNDDCYIQIVRSIKFYNRSIEFVDMINALLQNCYLEQIFLVIILISTDILWLLRIVDTGTDLTETLICITHVCATLFMVYINCYIGQRILNHCIAVYETGCTVSHYLFSQKVQKALLFVLMRTIKPASLSIGKMFTPSHEFFTALMKTAISYAMIFHDRQ